MSKNTKVVLAIAAALYFLSKSKKSEAMPGQDWYNRNVKK